MNPFGLVAVLILPYVRGSLTDTVLDRQQPHEQARTFEAATGEAVVEIGSGAVGMAPGETLVLCQGASICLGEGRFGGLATCQGGLVCQGKAVVFLSSFGEEDAREGQAEDELRDRDEEAPESDEEEREADASRPIVEGTDMDSAKLEGPAPDEEFLSAPEFLPADAAEGLYSCSGPHACDSWTAEGGRLVCESGYTCASLQQTGHPIKIPARTVLRSAVSLRHAVTILAKKVVKFRPTGGK